MKTKKLTGREKNFCRRYVCGINPGEAAKNAGFEGDCERIAQELLSRNEVIEEIERLCLLRRKISNQLAISGYERLAFGSIADAVTLLYMENPTAKELKGMDLFSVSEIRRPKDGSMEIKFFDRLKALEKLKENSQTDSGADSVYEAILAGARALNKSKEDEPCES